MQNKAKRKIDYKRVLWCLAMMVLGTMMFMVPAFAKAPSATKTMTNLISLMCSMFKFVGAAIFVWAIIQFILATKRSDADSKADAVQTAVCGIALMASPLSLQLLVLVPLSMMRTQNLLTTDCLVMAAVAAVAVEIDTMLHNNKLIC